MRILMSGGVKTQNIVNAIDKQFKASGDDFLVIEFLDDINGIFAKGEYFDKAIIAEQSITRDGTITDEYTIRQRINDFALECSHRARKLSYVFFTQSDDLATMIYDEILPIMDYSVVVLKAPPYFANFFKTIIVNDIGQLPSELVFVPKNISVESPIADMELPDEDILNDIDIIPTVEDIPMMSEDPDVELFGDPFNTSPQDIISDDIGINKGEYMPEDETMPEDDLIPPQDENYGEPIEDDPWNNMQELDTQDYGGDFGNDETNIDMDNTFNGARSNELPDYAENNMPSQESTGFIKGFDIDDEDGFGDDIYGNQEPTFDPYNQDVEATYNPMNDYGQEQYQGTIPLAEQQMEPEYDPLGQDLYGGGSQQIPQDQYANWDGEPNQAEIEEPQGYNPGFSPSDYDAVEQTQTNPGYGRQTGKKRKGLGSLLGGHQEDPGAMTMGNQPIGSKNIKKVKDALKPFAARGNSILVTGCGGCGTSTVAFHLANIISQLGYTVLLVDMDTEGRTQGYISKASYDSMDTDGSNLMSAVNSSTNTNSNAVVVKTGFHLLTMGLGTDIQPIEEQLHKEKIARFVSVVRTGYNFVIYDVPFRHAINFLSDITFMCDNLVLVTDASNWGITKTMLSVCNIDSDDMQDTIFHKAQLVFNKYRNLSRLFGLRVKTCDDIVQAMDRKVLDLVGDDIGLNFSRMSIAGIVNDDPMFENGWYEDVQYSETKKGQDIFIELIESIVLKKH